MRRASFAGSLPALVIVLVVWFAGDVVAQGRVADQRDVALAVRSVERARDQGATSERLLELADELLALLQQQPDAEAEVRGCLHRCHALQAMGDYPAALAAVEQATAALRPSMPQDLAASASYHRAVVAFRMSDYPAALAHAEQALAGYLALDDREQAATVHTLMGAASRGRSDYEEALASHLEALQLSEVLQDEAGIARSLNNIGLIYWKLERLERARTSLGRALDLYRSLGRAGVIKVVLSNLGLILIEMDRAAEALPHLEEALRRHQLANDPAGRSRVLSNLGFAYEKLGDDARAVAYVERALQMRLAIQDKRGIVRSRGALAKILHRQGHHERALPMIRQAVAMAAEIGARHEEAFLQRLLSESLRATGDATGALAAHRRYHELDAKLAEVRLGRRIAELEQKREVDQQRRRVAELSEAAAKREAELRQKELTEQVLIVGSSLLALGMVALYVLSRLRQQALRAVRHGAERLAESEQRYRMMFEGAAVPTVVVDPVDRVVVDWNGPAARLCRPPADEAQPVDDVEPIWVRVALRKMLDEGSGEDVAFDDCWVDPQGGLRWTEMRGSGVKLDGRACQLVSFRDTTAMHADREAQIRADKLESLGVMAGGIAHDFNNALTSIIGHVSLARSSALDADAESLRIAEQAAVQASRLTGQLLAFAKGGVPNRRLHDIGKLLREAVDLSAAGSGLRIELDVASSLRHAELDAGQFTQIVSNLIINANQATDEDGCLRIVASNFRGCPEAGAASSPGDYVRIDFADDGAGVPAGVQARIFEPYFTTKATGDGLGLATAFAIATSHEGALTLQSREGQGATFSVFFPASDGDRAVDADAPCSVPATAGGSILVLEDDPMVQRVYAGILERLGYDVEVVGDGAAAVQRYAERLAADRRFDLLIMDLTIVGGMGGRQALEQILARDAAARAIVASGYTDDPTMVHYRAAGFVAALPKPFQTDDLARVVAETMRVPR